MLLSRQTSWRRTDASSSSSLYTSAASRVLQKEQRTETREDEVPALDDRNRESELSSKMSVSNTSRKQIRAKKQTVKSQVEGREVEETMAETTEETIHRTSTGQRVDSEEVKVNREVTAQEMNAETKDLGSVVLASPPHRRRIGPDSNIQAEEVISEHGQPKQEVPPQRDDTASRLKTKAPGPSRAEEKKTFPPGKGSGGTLHLHT